MIYFLIILGGDMNKVEENVAGVGGWGGLCKCPDGKEYFAGDGGDGCTTLACDGGEKISCNQWEDDKWKHRKVTCSGNNEFDNRNIYLAIAIIR